MEKRWSRCSPVCLRGLAVDLNYVNHELWRRQQGYGRGGRMRIEKDEAHILSGVRHGKTIGSPIAMTLANHDWKNWTRFSPSRPAIPRYTSPSRPRPGHADLAGALKYNFKDARYVLERASARVRCTCSLRRAGQAAAARTRRACSEPRHRRRHRPTRARG